MEAAPVEIGFPWGMQQPQEHDPLTLRPNLDLTSVRGLADRLKAEKMNDGLTSHAVVRWVAEGSPARGRRGVRLRLPVVRLCGEFWTSAESLVRFLMDTQAGQRVFLPRDLNALRMRLMADRAMEAAHGGGDEEQPK